MWPFKKKKENDEEPYAEIEQEVDLEHPPEERDAALETIWVKRMLSHNVRMPMAVIAGYGELLKKKLLREDEKEQCIISICENITYMNQIIKVILDEESEEEIIDVGKIDMVDIAMKMKGYISDIATRNGVKVEVASFNPKLYAKGAVIPLMKIYYQLFENSFKYLKKSGSIRIRIYPEDDFIRVSFTDSGPGVPKEDLPRLFEKGFRGVNAGRAEGSGYGLFSVKNIVEGFGGNVEAKCEAGEGLTVIFRLPATNV